MLRNGDTSTGMSTSKWPWLLSQTRTESGLAVAIRSPCADGGCAAFRPNQESSRVRREIDPVIILDCKDSFECLCVPHDRLALECPRCDPSSIFRHSETADILRYQLCHLLAVLHSPHSKPILAADGDILGIRCKCHRTYFATDIDFYERGALLSNGQYRRGFVLLIRTAHYRRRGHQRHSVPEQ